MTDLATLGFEVDSKPLNDGVKALDSLSASAKKAETSASSLSQATTGASQTAKKLAEAVNDAAKKSEAADKAVSGVGHASSATSTQLQAMLHSIRGMVEGFALGMPVTQIMAQQISHLSYVATGPGGIKGALTDVGNLAKSFGGWLLGLLPALGFVGAGITALGAAAAALAAPWLAAQRRIELALTGIGSAAGVTAHDINEIASAASAAGQQTVGSARDIALALTSTGKISADVTAQAVALSKAFGLVFGTDAEDTAKTLARALADPAKGIETLNDRLAAYDDATVQLVRHLAAQNQLSTAQHIILDGVAASTENATKQTTLWGDAWDYVKRTASLVFGQIPEQISKASGYLDPYEKLRQAQQNVIEAQRQFDNAFTTFGKNIAAGRLHDAEKVLADITAELRRMGDEADRTKARVESISFGNLVRSIDPTLSQLATDMDNLDRLKADLANPLVLGGVDPATQAAARRAVDILQARIDSTKQYIALAEKTAGVSSASLGIAIRDHKLAIQTITARTDAQKGQIAFQSTLNELTRQGVPLNEALYRAELARGETLTQLTYDASEAARRRTLNMKEEIERAQLDLSLVGQTVGETARLTAQYEMLAAARADAERRGGVVSADEVTRINLVADALGKLATEKDLLQKSVDAEKAFASTLISDMRQGKSAIDSVTDALSQLAEKLLDNQLDVLFAGLKKSGFLPNLFDLGGSSAAAATTTGWATSIFPSADGNAFHGGNVIPFARGGIVTRPTLFPMATGAGLMGEAGPEAVMPLKRGADGKLGVAADGAGSTVQVIVNNNTGEKVTQRQSQVGNRQIVELFIGKVNSAMASGKFDKTMGQRFGARVLPVAR